MNALQHVMGFNEEDGSYAKAFMLRRLTQQYLMFDRKISYRDLGKEMGVSYELIGQYFRGRTYAKPMPGESEEHLEERRNLKEDAVEQAIERLSKKKQFLAPRIVGTADETYIKEAVIYPDLMRPA